ncbi:hypothetical protein PR048_006455 [Dryococelus australis]|uniref:DDE-1 domain-containing protein n=1 Tax=Dryococelus australis TaxID=614101 RepID=A0ABQ9IB09_9NEOP|nr:hypothetical protein PR048_006455 [Dryococelus australis]
MTPKGYITEEEFCNFLRYLNSHRTPGKALLIFYGHRSRLDNSELDIAESLEIQLFRLSAHCSHELQPLDKGLFKSLKVYWNSAVDDFGRKNPGRPLGNLQFRNLFTEAWTQATIPKNAMSGFRTTGIFPFIPQIIPETAFAPSDVSDRTPLQVILQLLALWRHPQYQQRLQHHQPATTLQYINIISECT